MSIVQNRRDSVRKCRAHDSAQLEYCDDGGSSRQDFPTCEHCRTNSPNAFYRLERVTIGTPQAFVHATHYFETIEAVHLYLSSVGDYNDFEPSDFRLFNQDILCEGLDYIDHVSFLLEDAYYDRESDPKYDVAKWRELLDGLRGKCDEGLINGLEKAHDKKVLNTKDEREIREFILVST